MSVAAPVCYLGALLVAYLRAADRSYMLTTPCVFSGMRAHARRQLLSRRCAHVLSTIAHQCAGVHAHIVVLVHLVEDVGKVGAHVRRHGERVNGVAGPAGRPGVGGHASGRGLGQPCAAPTTGL